MFVLYTALRTPCATCMAQQKAVYGINDLQTEAAEVQYPGSEVHYPTVDRRVPGSVHGSQHNLVMHEEVILHIIPLPHSLQNIFFSIFTFQNLITLS